jgi:hypothetical protein
MARVEGTMTYIMRYTHPTTGELITMRRACIPMPRFRMLLPRDRKDDHTRKLYRPICRTCHPPAWLAIGIEVQTGKPARIAIEDYIHERSQR